MPSITVTLSPSGAITYGAHWAIRGVTGWLDSAVAYTVIAGDYTLIYKPVEGYTTPANETVTMVATPLTPTGVYATTAWKSGWNPPVSMCLFRGQVITVGEKYTTIDTNLKKARIVRWSEIGAFRFLGATANALKNEAGEYYLSENLLNTAMKVLPTKTGFIVYGSYTTTVFEPVSQPAPTYGIAKTLPIGIANPLAVSGDERKHIVVDRTGSLWVISLGETNILGNKSIGYSDIFGPMQAGLSMTTGVGIIAVVYNPDEDETYISNGVDSYLFNEVGLTRIDKAITSYITQKGSLLSDSLVSTLTTKPLSTVTTVDSAGYCSFETDIIDFNMRAIKTIKAIEVSGSTGSSVQAEVLIKYRYNTSDSFSSSPWICCSPHGTMQRPFSGREFKICYRTAYSRDVNVSSIMIEWQLSDKMSVRGAYTNASGNAS